jgi:hypothetical protein
MSTPVERKHLDLSRGRLSHDEQVIEDGLAQAVVVIRLEEIEAAMAAYRRGELTTSHVIGIVDSAATECALIRVLRDRPFMHEKR